METENMKTVVHFIHRSLQLGAEIQSSSGPKLVDFKKACSNAEWTSKIDNLKKEVECFATKFMLPGQRIL